MVFDLAFQSGTQLVLKYAADWLRNSVKPPELDHPRVHSILPPMETQGCPACKLHRELAEADSLIVRLSQHLDSSGKIPEGLGGTIPLARQNVDQAMTYLGPIALSAPELKNDCIMLEKHLSQVGSKLSGELTGQDIRAVSPDVHSCADEGYDLTHKFFSRKPEVDPLEQWYQKVKTSDVRMTDALRELKEILNAQS